MKESEAKTKWCPMIRVIITPNNGAWQNNMLNNRGDIPEDNTQCCCIGSACMMWIPRQINHTYSEIGDEIPEGDCGLKTKETP